MLRNVQSSRLMRQEEELKHLQKLKEVQLHFLKLGHMVAKCNLISSELRAPSSSMQQLYLIPSVSVAYLEKTWEKANILINQRQNK